MTHTLRSASRLTQHIPQLAAIGLWCLIMVSVPILGWTLGEAALLQGVIAGTLAQAVAVVAILRLDWPWGKIGRMLLIITVVTLLVEAVGTGTGFPFGRYTYTDRLQPQILHVPLLIPIAWFMMLPCAWVVAAATAHNRWAFAAASATALTVWDLLLDPQMVNWQLWIWDNPGGYFGIPWSNFAGWFITGFILTALLYPMLRPAPDGHSAKTRAPGATDVITELFNRDVAIGLMVVYSIVWFLETFGLAFFWGLPGPAIAGGLAMGICMMLGWRALNLWGSP